MSTKHVRTGADVCRFGCSVKVECGSCHAARTLSGIEWVTASGAGSLEAARARLKCGRCGRKAARLSLMLAKWKPEERMVQVAWPDERKSLRNVIQRLSAHRDATDNPILRCFSYLCAPNVYLFGLPISQIDLRGCEMPNANFAGCHLISADLRHGNFEGATFERAMLDRARLDHANLHQANLVDARLEDTFFSGASFHRTHVSTLSLIFADEEWVQQEAENLVLRDRYYRSEHYNKLLTDSKRVKALRALIRESQEELD